KVDALSLPQIGKGRYLRYLRPEWRRLGGGSGSRAAYRMQTTDSYDLGVFVFDADDVAVIRDNKTPTVRDNVLFELGLFIGSGSAAIDARAALEWSSVFYRFLAQVSVIRSFHPGQD